MTIRLNGEPVEAGEAVSVADLVARYRLPAETLLIEHNGVALHRREWIDRSLGENDQVEFIRIAAGG